MDLHIVDDKWHSAGPTLPIELSRLSDKRLHLTYVLDERHQRRVPTRYAISKYGQLEDVITDLACREGCAAHSIGFVEASEGRPHRSRTSLWKEILQWVRSQQFDAAVWTDLAPKFPGEFTLDSAVAFWKQLPGHTAEKARRYAQEAPEEVDTDLRRRLGAEGLV